MFKIICFPASGWMIIPSETLGMIIRIPSSVSQSPTGKPNWRLWLQCHSEPESLGGIPSETLGTRICTPQGKSGRVICFPVSGWEAKLETLAPVPYSEPESLGGFPARRWERESASLKTKMAEYQIDRHQ
ncbi:MAG: hypothetical protein AAF327_20760 [Cyanobacteria bacterium P01_A01_bin.37]